MMGDLLLAYVVADLLLAGRGTSALAGGLAGLVAGGARGRRDAREKQRRVEARELRKTPRGRRRLARRERREAFLAGAREGFLAGASRGDERAREWRREAVSRARRRLAGPVSRGAPARPTESAGARETGAGEDHQGPSASGGSTEERTVMPDTPTESRPGGEVNGAAAMLAEAAAIERTVEGLLAALARLSTRCALTVDEGARYDIPGVGDDALGAVRAAHQSLAEAAEQIEGWRRSLRAEHETAVDALDGARSQAARQYAGDR